MNEGSFIVLYRKLRDWEWYTDSKMVHIFIHLLLMASYKDSNYRGVKIKRGQLLTGRLSISQSTGISHQSVRTCLRRLVLTNEIAIEPTNQYSIITICNYDFYQRFDRKSTSKTTNKNKDSEQTTNNDTTTFNAVETKLTKVFTPPTVLEVEEYFVSKGFLRSKGKEAHEYYDVAGWLDRNGNKVRNWKQKMHGVWFKDENRDPSFKKELTFDERQKQKAMRDGIPLK